MSKDRWKVYTDDVPFHKQFPGYARRKYLYYDYIDRLNFTEIYEWFMRIYGVEPTRIYYNDIFQYMREALKDLPGEHSPIFRWEGNKKIVSTWVPEENIILLAERKDILDLINKLYPESYRGALQSARSIFQDLRRPTAVMPTGSTWDIMADMMWEFGSKIEDKTLADGFKRLTKLSHEELDNILDIIDNDIMLSNDRKELLAGVIRQIKNKPNAEYIHHTLINETQSIVDDIFFTPSPIGADDYKGGLYSVKDPKIKADIKGRKAARNPALVDAFKKEAQKIIDAGFKPAEAAHIMHSILLQRLLEDGTITPSQAMAMDKDLVPSLPNIKPGNRNKIIKKAASMGLKLSKKLPVILLAGLFHNLITGEDEGGEGGAMLAAGTIFNIGEKPKKKAIIEGIADVLYGGDITQVTKPDIKHIAKRWKFYDQYTLSQLQDAASKFTLEELTDPVERQMMLQLKIIVSIHKASEKAAARSKAAADKLTKTARQQAFEQYVGNFKTEKVRAEATLRRLSDDLKYAETPLKRAQLEKAIDVTTQRIAALDQNIAAAAETFKKQGGFVEAPGRSYTSRVSDALEKASEAVYEKGQKSIFTPDQFADLYKHAPVGSKGLAKVGASLAPFFAMDVMDFWGVVSEPSEARMYEDIGSMIVGKQPGERRRLPITKEEIEAFEDVGGKFQTTPTDADDESLMEMFFPGSMAEGQVYVSTERNSILDRMLYQKPSDIEEVKIQVNQELAKKYMNYVMSRDRLDRETGEWIKSTAGEFQDAIERNTFEEAAKNYAAWQKGPSGPSRSDLQRAEELTREHQVTPSKTALPPGPWGDVLMHPERPKKEEKIREPRDPAAAPKKAPLRKGDRPSKRTVPPGHQPSPYKKNLPAVPLKPVDPKADAARLLLGEPMFDFIPTRVPDATRLYGLIPGMPIVGDVK